MLDHDTVAGQINPNDESKYPYKDSFMECLQRAKKIANDRSLVLCIERTMELLD